MRVSRLYVAQALTEKTTLNLDDASAHYLRTVLRLKKNDDLILFNGTGIEYPGKLEEVSKNSVQVNIYSSITRSVESPLTINLGLGVSRGDRMDLAIQKAVELGVSSITPILTDRCVVQLKGDKKQQRLEHWRKIIQHATEQSGRTVLPKLTDIFLLQNWVIHQSGLKIFLDPYAEATLNGLDPVEMKVTLLTGPEGGFTDQERQVAKTANFVPVRLGSRILRAETAAITALAAVQMSWGDFRA